MTTGGRLLRALVPPLAWHTARWARRRWLGGEYGFSGDYSSFEQARAHSTGYEAQPALDATARHAERDLAVGAGGGAITELEQQLLAALAVVALGSAPEPLRVLDLGGALGGHYRLLRRLVSGTRPIEWTVCETPAMAELGRARFSNEELTFVSDPTFRRSVAGYHLVLASGSLQYLPDPDLVWQALLGHRASYWLITRLPLLPRDRNTLAVQRVPPHLFEGSFPVWLFSEQLWAQRIRSDHEVVMCWRVRQDAHSYRGQPVSYHGFLLKTK